MTFPTPKKGFLKFRRVSLYSDPALSKVRNSEAYWILHDYYLQHWIEACVVFNFFMRYTAVNFFHVFFFPKNYLSESISFCEYLKFKKVFLLTNFFWDLPKVENSRNNIEVWKFICAEVDLGMMTLLSYQRSLLHTGVTGDMLKERWRFPLITKSDYNRINIINNSVITS